VCKGFGWVLSIGRRSVACCFATFNVIHMMNSLEISTAVYDSLFSSPVMNDQPYADELGPLNVVVFFPDDWRYDAIGDAQPGVVHTPFLSKLAHDGIRYYFDLLDLPCYFVHWSLCVPTQIGMTVRSCLCDAVDVEWILACNVAEIWWILCRPYRQMAVPE
jgi:hypothetical protein